MPKTNLAKAKPQRPKSRMNLAAEPVQVPIVEAVDAPQPPQPAPAKQPPKKGAGTAPSSSAPAPAPTVTPQMMVHLMTVALGTVGSIMGAQPTQQEVAMVAESAAVVANKYSGMFKYADEAAFAAVLGVVLVRLYKDGQAAKAEAARLELERRLGGPQKEAA